MIQTYTDTFNTPLGIPKWQKYTFSQMHKKDVENT